MRVLGIETATMVCGAAVTEKGRVVAECQVEARNVHAERLMSLVEQALASAGAGLDAVDAIAVSEGPGSFTGLRVGVSVAKGLAYATGKPLVGVPTLGALAQQAVRASAVPPGKVIVPLLDARRGEVYYQLFSHENGAAIPIGEPRAAEISEVVALLAEHPAVLTGEAAGTVQRMGPAGGASVQAGRDIARCHAATIALMGEALVRDGASAALEDFEPRYVKEFFPTAP